MGAIILPTYEEAGTIGSTIRDLRSAVDDTSEICVVDDSSTEATADVVRDIDDVSLVRRPDGDGLGSAVLRGIAETSADRIVVMDADGQHPPDSVPALFQALDLCDCVVGSRHIGGGGNVSEWGLRRYLMSAGASALAWLAVPKSRPIQDPMSGMFGVRRAVVVSVFDRLEPEGHKILLEILAKAPIQRLGEVPITFREREEGESTTDASEMRRYLRHLGRLAVQSRRPTVPERVSADQLEQL